MACNLVEGNRVPSTLVSTKIHDVTPQKYGNIYTDCHDSFISHVRVSLEEEKKVKPECQPATRFRLEV